MGGHRFPPRPQAAGPRRLSPVPEMTVRTFNAHIRRRVPRRPLLVQRRLPWPSPWWDRLGTLLARPKAGCLTTLAQASLSLQTARSLLPRFAPGLSAHARGHRYRGPRRLPGPDSHRQAIPNLSLGLCHDQLLSLMRPSSLGAPHHCMSLMPARLHGPGAQGEPPERAAYSRQARSAHGQRAGNACALAQTNAQPAGDRGEPEQLCYGAAVVELDLEVTGHHR